MWDSGPDVVTLLAAGFGSWILQGGLMVESFHLSILSEILHHLQNKTKAWQNAVKYLNFWHDRSFLCTGAGEGRQWGWRHDWVGAGEVAKVTAGNLILLMPHDNSLHDKETIPG